LARLHWDTAVGETVKLQVAMDVGVAADLIVGAGFEPVGPHTVRRLRTLPDTVGPGMRVLVCGLNPSLVAADAGFGYAGATNRFWPAAIASGLVTKARDAVHALQVDGVGMTDLVKRATPSAAELTPDEYRTGAQRVERLVAWLRPKVVLFVGLTGWRVAVDRRAAPGWQPSTFGGGVAAYVMPSTSGLNAHTSRAELEAHMKTAIAPTGSPT
jgi:TDG/mug DNA glycosylase family protein